MSYPIQNNNRKFRKKTKNRIVGSFFFSPSTVCFLSSSPFHLKFISKKVQSHCHSVHQDEEDRVNNYHEDDPKDQETLSYPFLEKETNETAAILQLSQLLRPSLSCSIDQLSPTSLAYIGDVVFELYVRSRYVWPAKRTTDLQNVVVQSVRAEMQAFLLHQMISSFPLTAKEFVILKRGRNSASGRKTFPKRLSSSSSSSSSSLFSTPNHGTITGGSSSNNNSSSSNNNNNNSSSGGASIYQDATAFEALLGYLYMADPSRCYDVLQFVCTEWDKKSQ